MYDVHQFLFCLASNSDNEFYFDNAPVCDQIEALSLGQVTGCLDTEFLEELRVTWNDQFRNCAVDHHDFYDAPYATANPFREENPVPYDDIVYLFDALEIDYWVDQTVRNWGY